MSEERIPLIPVTTVGPLLVTKSACAKALSVSERTLDYWRAKNVIPCLQFSERFVRFDLAEVRAALERRYKMQAKGGVKIKTTTYKKGQE
jgi:hypothetical protein